MWSYGGAWAGRGCARLHPSFVGKTNEVQFAESSEVDESWERRLARVLQVEGHALEGQHGVDVLDLDTLRHRHGVAA